MKTHPSYYFKLLILLKLLLILGLSNSLLGQDFAWAMKIRDTQNTAGNGEIKADKDGNIIAIGTIGITSFDLDPGPGTAIISGPGRGMYVVKYDEFGNYLWSHGFKGKDVLSSVTAVDMTVDDAGSVIMICHVRGEADFDPGPDSTVFSVPALSNGVVIKLDKDGIFQWAHVLDDESSARYTHLSTDFVNNVILTGFFVDTIDFDPGPGTIIRTQPAHPFAGFVQKLDSNGDFLWVNTAAGNHVGLYHVDVDMTGEIIIVGDYNGTLGLNGQSTQDTLHSTNPCPQANSCREALVWKMSSRGETQWIREIKGGITWMDVGGVSTDNLGNIIFAGRYVSEGVDFDPGPDTLFIEGRPDILNHYNSFVVKLSPAGDLAWAKAFTGGRSRIRAMDVDENGNFYATGFFSDTLDFDPDSTVLNLDGGNFTGTGADIFVVRLSEQGNLSWAFQITAFGSYGDGISVDNKGSIYTTGSFAGRQIDFDPGPATYFLDNTNSRGYHYRFIQKVDQGFCDDMNFRVDSLLDLSCTQNGIIYTSTKYGVPPYTYNWNVDSLKPWSQALVDSPGIYNLIVTDSAGCSRSASIPVSGPSIKDAYDFDAQLVASSFRTGFNAYGWINVKNIGCESTDATIKLVLDSLISVSSVFPMPDSVIGDTLIWTQNAMDYDSPDFLASLEFLTSLNSQIGDTVCLELSVTPVIDDNNPSDNFRTYCLPIINSYDPNDIKINPQGECADAYVGKDQELTYTVRFQNTGNAEAININIQVPIDSSLDISTLQVFEESHSPMVSEIISGARGDTLIFRFRNIFLPDSSSNEAESHGYVVFKLKPLPALADGVKIHEEAHIFFDFNPAIITNKVSVTLIDDVPLCDPNTTSLEEEVSQILVYPNPAYDIVQLESPEALVSLIQIMDPKGRIVWTQELNEHAYLINLKFLTQGLYFVVVETNKGKYIQKLLKR